ncbi:MAG TPA: type II secretion system protein GspL [Casimicrobiaceae bacterium]|nr:type II secretion system protein GspL [Casimicrobiaceae bacterium]
MLRVFVAGFPSAERPPHWVRYALDGRAIAHGQDVPSRLPADPNVEIVLAAHQARLVALALPPMPRSRLAGAARYALEDQIASAPGESCIALAKQTNGTCIAAIASQALIRAIESHVPRASRIVPESALAPCADGWTWCRSATGDGFVRRADGSAFVVTQADANDDLPLELAAALDVAKRTHDTPSRVRVAFSIDAAQLTRWSQSSGIAFAAAPAWRWEDAPAAAFAAAPDFRSDDDKLGDTTANRTGIVRAFRPALLLGGLALALYVGGLAVQWSYLTFENWRLSRALVSEAAAAQLTDAATPAAAVAAIARRNAEVLHHAMKSVSTDALPLLARAAPALDALPTRTLRSARYAGGAWTLELGKVDAATLSRVTRSLAATGIDTLSAPTQAGTRMRLALSPSAR